MSVQRFSDDIELSVLEEAVSAVSLLSPNSLVIVEGVAAQKQLHEGLIDLLDQVGEQTTLVIAEPNLDKRGKLYKALRHKSDFQTFEPKDEFQLTDWAVKRFADSHVTIDRSVVRHLVQRVGEDQWRLHSEIEKLRNFSRPVTLSLIDETVELHPRETIFQLLDEIMAGETGRALKLYSSLIEQQMDPTYILSMIMWQLRNISLVFSAANLTDRDILSQASISPYVLRKTRQAITHVSRRSIRRMWQEVLTTDAKIKTISVNQHLIIEQLITKLSTLSK